MRVPICKSMVLQVYYAKSLLVCVFMQIVVTLLDSLLEGGKITAAAARVLEDLIVGRQGLLGKRLQSIPPLPAHIQGLSNVYAVMKKERGNLTAEEQCRLLVDSLAHPSLSVRGTSLMVWPCLHVSHCVCLSLYHVSALQSQRPACKPLRVLVPT
jgi:hypothetical protein